MHAAARHSVLLGLSAAALLVHAGAIAADAPLRDLIDAEVDAALKQQNITPAPQSSDAVFLRRVYLDLIGTIPTHEEARAFLDDEAPDKRARLIDRLLAEPRFAVHQTDVWDMVLFGRDPPGYDADKRPGFERWMQEQFAANTPWDKVIGAMLRAQGDTVEHGATYFLLQYRRQPEDAAQAITQRFLGVQLQCARCHDHPYEDWKQLEFYGMAAFLARLDPVEVGKQGDEKKVMIGEHSVGDVEFTGPATQQQAGKKGVPVPPKFLGGDVLNEPQLPEDFKQIKFKNGEAPPPPKFSRKDALADWIVARENPFFARAAANRFWSQFMGRGIVHPVDDMSPSNKPTHPKLLEAMTQQFVAHDFDVKWLIREIVSSRAYQRGEGGDFAPAAPQWYERARVRPLSAEELTDAWRIANSFVEAEKDAAERIEKDRFHPFTGGYVLAFFGEPTNGQGHFQGGLHEHLYLNNGGVDRGITRGKGGLFDAVANGDQPWPQRVERLFLSVLSRYPTDAEREKFVAYLSADERPDDRVKEAIWALMTCSEFRFNH